MEKSIYFDMDGTIAELYKVPNWLPKLRAEDPSPYAEAEPKVNLIELAKVLEAFKADGYTVGVITWLSMNSSESYKTATRKAKADWLKKIPFVFDEIHMVKYGAPKHQIAKVKGGILVDDNKEVREKWEKNGGIAIDAEPSDWLKILKEVR